MNSASFQYTPPCIPELLLPPLSPPPYSFQDNNNTSNGSNNYTNTNTNAIQHKETEEHKSCNKLDFEHEREIDRIAHPHASYQLNPPSIRFNQPVNVETTPLMKAPRKSMDSDYCVMFNSTEQCKPRYRIPWEIEKQKVHDWIFIPIFPLVVGAFVMIAYKSLKSIITSGNYKNFSVPIFNINPHKQIIIVLGVLSVVLFLGFIQMLGLLFFYRFFISMIFTVGVTTSAGLVWYFYINQMWIYCALGAMALIAIVFSMHKVRHKLKFSSELMRSGSQMMRSNASVWIIYTIMFLINTFAVLFYFLVLYASYFTWKDERNKSIKYSIFSLLIFSGYYLYEVFQNSMNVIVGSICAKWYFQSDVSDSKAILTPFFNCFGSICVGSLLASLVTFVKEMVMFSKPNDKLLKNPIIRINWRVAQMALAFLDFTVQYFNQYSFAYIAIHSRGYFRSSHKMHKLYKRKGFSVLLNESIIKGILQLYMLFSGVLVGTITYIIAQWCIHNVKSPDFNLSNPKNATVFVWSAVAAASLTAVQISRMTALLINSYVHVFLVCVIEYPEILEKTHADIYATLSEHLPTRRIKSLQTTEEIRRTMAQHN